MLRIPACGSYRIVARRKNPAMVDISKVRKALEAVMDPELKRSLVELGMVKDIQANGSRVEVTVALTTPGCPLKKRISDDVKQAAMTVPGVDNVDVKFTTLSAKERVRTLGGDDSQPSQAQQLSNVHQVVAVMSGKGGVGKSLVTALLAVSLARDGRKVGILDADITGPSVPKMFGLTQSPKGSELGLFPAETRIGINVISINLLLPQDDLPVIWRGPLIANTIKQFWKDVVWGDMDYLLVDLPPGTSDAPLTVMQSLPLSGVVVVSSPQDLAGMVVRKAVKMAEQLKVPVLGVVENMSYFTCPDNGKQYEIFGPSRGEELATAAGAPLLAKLPLDPAIAQLCDAGRVEEYQSEAYDTLARAFAEVAVPPEESCVGREARN
jgi:Mrp family chromosome partitioning ATPase